MAAVNLAPVNTLPASYSTSEDTFLSLSGLSISDADAGAGSMTVTLAVTSGVLYTASGGSVTATGSGTATLVLTGTLANINAFLGAAASRPLFNTALDMTGAVTLAMTTNDNGNTGTGGAKTDVDNVTITVSALNDPPYVDLDGAPSSAGTNLVTNGHFSGGSSTSWTTAVMAGNPSGPIQFPNNQNSPLITAPAGTSALGAFWNFADNDGAIGPASVVLQNTTAMTLTAGQAYTFSFDVDFNTNATQALNFSWVLLNASNQPVMTLPGRYTTGGTGANPSATVLTFNTWQQFQTTFLSSLATGTYTLGLTWDSPPATNGDADDLLFDRIHLGAEPANYSTTYTENGAGTALAPATDVITDPDNANMTAATITLTNPQTGDRLLVGGSAAASGTLGSGIAWTRTDNLVTLSGSFTRAQYATALQQVQFQNITEDPNAAVVRDVTVTVNDGSVISNTAHTFITVTAVNDAPVANDDNFTTTEEVAITNQPLTGNDSDVDHTNAQLTWSLVSGGTAAANGVLTVNTNGTFSYTPATDVTGTFSFTYQACDPGPLCDPATVTITVSAVNDPPLISLGANVVTNGSFESGNAGWTGNSGGVEVNPVTSYSVPAAPNGSKVMEVEASAIAPTSTRAYVTQTITTVVGQSYRFSIQAIDRLDFNVGDMGALNVNGVDLLTFTAATTWTPYSVVFTATGTSTIIRIYSNGSTGSPALSAPLPGDGAGLIVDDVQVLPVNFSTTYVENGAGVALAAVTDQVLDVDNANMTTATITLTNPQNGDRLLVGGSAAASGTLGSGITWTRTNNLVTLSGSFTKAQYAAALQQIQFNSTSDDPNTAIVRDIASTVNDGALSSNTAHTYVTVAATNDAPVNTLPTPFSTPKNAVLSLAGLSITDPDAGSGTITITLSLASGLLNASSGGGVTVTNSGTAAITLSGTLTDLNAFLASATTRPVFTPVFNFTGAVILTMVTNDNGNTGGSALSDTDMAMITVTAANRPPVVALGTNLLYNGSFESGTMGWSNNSVMEAQPVSFFGVPAAPDGTNVSEVEGNVALVPTSTPSVLSQTITTVVGRTYLFSVQAVNRIPFNTADRGYLNVAGTNVLSFTTGNTWSTYYTTFTATSTSTVISIISNGSASGSAALPGDGKGVVVDDVAVTEVNYATSYTENGAGVALAAAGDRVVDADNANMASATITLTNPQTGDRLLVDGSAAASGTLASGIAWTCTNTVVTLSGSFTKADYAAALPLIQFENTTDDPNGGVLRDVTVTVNDGTSNSNTAHTVITVVAVNDAPVANDDGFTTTKNVAITGQPLLGNDSDPDNTAAQTTWTLEDGGTAIESGTLVVNTDGTFTFTPFNEFLGTVTFTYRMCDTGPLCDLAQVSIVVFSPLPVELLGFDGRNEGPVNHLFWATASERDCDRFEVERSADAETFIRLGAVPGAGNSQQLRHYAFDDTAPLEGVNYYRLKQVDTDGVFEYSPVISVIHALGEGGDHRVATVDPAGLFMLEGALADDARVELMDTYGQLVRGGATLSGGRCYIDLRGLPVAMYVARVTEGGKVRTYKLMKR